MSNAFDGFLSTAQAVEAFGDRSLVAAMLRFEAALVNAQAKAGLVPLAAAQSIIGTCKVDLFDPARIVQDSARAGSLAIPLVRALKETVELFNPEAGEFVHFGSTSQDVIDSAMALIAKNLLASIEADLRSCALNLLAMAQAHAETPLLARTLMQPASVTSFGLTCTVWAAPLVRSLRRLKSAGANALQLQLGGAVGTFARMQGKQAQIIDSMATELGLEAPTAPWHTQRDEWVALCCELGLMTGSLGKIAKDISLMGQFEVAELAEPFEIGRGASSDMGHKRNPVACMVALAAAQRAPQRVAAVLATMPQEHERALGGWQAELAESAQLFMIAQASARAMAQALAGLQIDPVRMRANIAAVAQSQGKGGGRTWFDVALAQSAGEQARTYVEALRVELAP